jgi:superfamily I DNA/RNA helicase
MPAGCQFSLCTSLKGLEFPVVSTVGENEPVPYSWGIEEPKKNRRAKARSDAQERRLFNSP